MRERERGGERDRVRGCLLLVFGFGYLDLPAGEVDGNKRKERGERGGRGG